MSLHDLLQIATSRKTTTPNSLPSPLIDLVSKIDQISNSIDINLSKNPLKKLGLQNNKRDLHGHQDPLTKLKNIENKSEINRAQVQLIIQRKPKRYSSLQRKEYQHQENYMQIYKQLKTQKVFKEHKETEFNSEDEISEPNQTPPRNIKHYSLLRRHPKILEFTLQKMKSRNSQENLQFQKELQKTMINQASRPGSLLFNQDFKQVIENLKKDEVDPLSSPKAIVQNQLTKFYSKSSKGKIDAKIRENPRCNLFLVRQEQIIMRAENSNVSKQNMKKLKEKLNGIVNEINKNDKNSSKDHLPRLASSRQSTNIKSMSITERF